VEHQPATGRCFAIGEPKEKLDLHRYRANGEHMVTTRDHDQIVETSTEARQAEPGPSVLALLTVSTGLAVLILGVVWFVFFRG
jgi:hypothetical protein